MALANGTFLVDTSAARGDFLDRLSPTTRDLIDRAETQRFERGNNVQARFDLKMDLIRKRDEHKSILARYVRDVEYHGLVHDKNSRAEVARHEKQLQRVNARIEKLDAEAAAGNAVPMLLNLEQVDEFIGENTRREFTIVESTFELPPGKTLHDARAYHQVEIRERQEQAAAVRKSPLSTDEAETRYESDLRALAEQGRPNFAPLFRVHRDERGRERSQGVVWPTRLKSVAAPGGGFDTVEEPKALEILVWANFDSMLQRGLDEIAATSPPNSMTFDERTTKLAALNAEILSLERIEEAICRAIEAETGEDCPRRADANPLAILEIEFVR